MEEKQMYDATKILTGLFFISSLTSGATSFASEEASSVATKTTIASSEASQERNVLQRLTAALVVGSEGMRPLRGSPAEDDMKNRLEPPIPGMDCVIDRILSYVSCYSPTTHVKREADDRFWGFINELQDVLPANRWRGAQTQPRVNSISSYTFEDPISDATIDVDLIELPTAEGESYTVTFYGWTAPDQRLPD